VQRPPSRALPEPAQRGRPAPFRHLRQKPVDRPAGRCAHRPGLNPLAGKLAPGAPWRYCSIYEIGGGWDRSVIL
jgi:hypothetical protein